MTAKAPLRAVKDTKGGGHVGAMTGAMVATSIVFFPAAPLFLFMHGKDITIPKGTEITAYISGDTRLDEAKFQPVKPDITTAALTNAAVTLVDITSNPTGADIELDGKFVGSTPSSIVFPPEITISLLRKAASLRGIKECRFQPGTSTCQRSLRLSRNS